MGEQRIRGFEVLFYCIANNPRDRNLLFFGDSLEFAISVCRESHRRPRRLMRRLQGSIRSLHGWRLRCLPSLHQLTPGWCISMCDCYRWNPKARLPLAHTCISPVETSFNGTEGPSQAPPPLDPRNNDAPGISIGGSRMLLTKYPGVYFNSSRPRRLQ